MSDSSGYYADLLVLIGWATSVMQIRSVIYVHIYIPYTCSK